LILSVVAMVAVLAGLVRVAMLAFGGDPAM
jgi:hypothetical protein